MDESSKVRQGERLPGTTEVLESCFGKLKALEDGQSKSGFTGLVLSLGAMVSKWTAESIGEALERCRVRDVLDWCRKNLGPSVQSQRSQAYTHTAMRNKSGINPTKSSPTFHRATLALLPPQNATVYFVKMVQRLPVARADRLRPGQGPLLRRPSAAP